MSVDICAHYDEIYKYCYFKIKDIHVAEDLTQETFLKFIKQNNYVDRNKPLAYLYTIAKNTCIDYLRKDKPIPLSDEIIDYGLYEQLEIRAAVKDAVEILPSDEQELIFLRYVSELKLGDIVKVTGISRFAVHRKLKKAMDSLKTVLKEEDFFD